MTWNDTVYILYFIVYISVYPYIYSLYFNISLVLFSISISAPPVVPCPAPKTKTTEQMQTAEKTAEQTIKFPQALLFLRWLLSTEKRFTLFHHCQSWTWEKLIG